MSVEHGGGSKQVLTERCNHSKRLVGDARGHAVARLARLCVAGRLHQERGGGKRPSASRALKYTYYKNLPHCAQQVMKATAVARCSWDPSRHAI